MIVKKLISTILILSIASLATGAIDYSSQAFRFFEFGLFQEAMYSLIAGIDVNLKKIKKEDRAEIILYKEIMRNLILKKPIDKLIAKTNLKDNPELNLMTAFLSFNDLKTEELLKIAEKSEHTAILLANHHVIKGLKAYQAKDYKKTVDFIELGLKEIKKSEQDPLLKASKGDMWKGLKQKQIAILSLLIGDCLIELGDLKKAAYYLKFAQQYIKNEAIISLLKIIPYQNTINKNPNKKELLVKMYGGIGLEYYNLKRYEKAENNYKKALTINAKFWQAYSGLALVELAEKNYDKAIVYLDKAIKIADDKDKKLYMIYFQKGKVYLEKKEYKLALDSFTIARKYGSESVIEKAMLLAYNLAQLEAFQTDSLNNEEKYIKAKLSMEASRILEELGLTEQALYHSSIAQMLTGDIASLEYMISQLYKLDKIEYIIELVDNFKNKGKLNIESIVSYSASLQKLGRYKEAELEIKKAKKIDSKNWLVYNQEGYMHLNTGANKKAIKSFEEAIRLNPDKDYRSHIALVISIIK